MSISLTKDEAARVRHTIEESVRLKQQMKDLRDSMNDLLSTVSKDLEIPKKTLNKAVRIKFKATQIGDKDTVIAGEQEELDEATQLLVL